MNIRDRLKADNRYRGAIAYLASFGFKPEHIGEIMAEEEPISEIEFMAMLKMKLGLKDVREIIIDCKNLGLVKEKENDILPK